MGTICCSNRSDKAFFHRDSLVLNYTRLPSENYNEVTIQYINLMYSRYLKQYAKSSYVSTESAKVRSKLPSTCLICLKSMKRDQRRFLRLSSRISGLLQHTTRHIASCRSFPVTYMIFPRSFT